MTPSLSSEVTSSSLADFIARERLLNGSSSLSSTGSSSPSRASQTSLIKNRAVRYHAWQRHLPLVIASALLLLFTVTVILLWAAFLRVRADHFECRKEGENPHEIHVREDTRRLDLISDQLLHRFDASRIGEDLKWMSKKSHIAGMPENAVLIRNIAERYDALGFEVRIHNYSVLLNYPDFNAPNTLEMEENGVWRMISTGLGKPLGPVEAMKEQSDIRSQVWWNAYSGNGTVEAPIVYCNYGTREDFETLEELDISVRDVIVLIRYGLISRERKVREAEKRGARGVVLFSDPVHSTTDRNHTFPHSISLPALDVQRGSVMSTHGDPLTPLLPSLPYVTREESIESIRQKGHLPRIPVTVIGYGIAEKVMRSLDGDVVKIPQWIGGLSVPYRFGGSANFRLNVRSRNVRRTISNVIATWKGREEPDKWIMLGNHVDAWGSGAIDPLSGTATQLEMARVASEIFSETPPRRSLVFCHWDAEEFGLIGSTEWLEEMQLTVNQRAVAYINVDHIAGTVALDIKSVPLLYRVLGDAARRIPHPNAEEVRGGRETLFDAWRHYRAKGPILGDRAVPEIGLPAGGSDYQRFISFSGVPSADIKLEMASAQSYPLYHTMYETMWTVENLLDGDFTSFAAIGQLWMEVAHRLANSLVIPFHAPDYSQFLSNYLQRSEALLVRYGIADALPDYRIKMDNLKDSIKRFHHAARYLQTEIQDVSSGLDTISVSRLHTLNERLQYLERSFLDPLAFESGIYRHLIFSPSRHAPHVSCFSNLLDSAVDYFHSQSNETMLPPVVSAFNRLQYSIESATHFISL